MSNIYIVKYTGNECSNETIEAITNNPKQWIKEHNARRIEDGNDPECESDFEIESYELTIYGKSIIEKIYNAMTKLDNAIPNWAFDSESGQAMQDAIQDVYDSIDEAKEFCDA